MDIAYCESFLQLIIGNVTIQSGWKRFCNIIVNLCMIVSINSRKQKHQENHSPKLVMLCNKCRRFIHSGKKQLMLCLLNGLVKKQNQCRKNGYTADNTNNNALCHNNTKVTSKSKGHNTKCNEAGYCGNRASSYRLKSICNGMPHGTVLFSRKTLLIFLIAVQKENGIIHGNTQLKYRGKCLCNIRGLAQNNITSQVVKDSKSNTEQEQKRNNKGSACQLQNDQTEYCCDHNVNRQLLHGNVLNICNNSCHATEEALLVGNLT